MILDNIRYTVYQHLPNLVADFTSRDYSPYATMGLGMPTTYRIITFV